MLLAGTQSLLPFTSTFDIPCSIFDIPFPPPSSIIPRPQRATRNPQHEIRAICVACASANGYLWLKFVSINVNLCHRYSWLNPELNTQNSKLPASSVPNFSSCSSCLRGGKAAAKKRTFSHFLARFCNFLHFLAIFTHFLTFSCNFLHFFALFCTFSPTHSTQTPQTNLTTLIFDPKTNIPQ